MITIEEGTNMKHYDDKNQNDSIYEVLQLNQSSRIPNVKYYNDKCQIGFEIFSTTMINSQVGFKI